MTLWAKAPGERGDTLEGHTAECLEALDDLMESGFITRLYEVMGVANAGAAEHLVYETPEALYQDARVAVTLHDLGKAGSEFQTYLPQAHERDKALKALEAQVEEAFAQEEAKRAQALLVRLKELRASRPHKQAFRHEYLSAYIAETLPAVREWFHAKVPDHNRRSAILAAIYGHHIKTNREPQKVTLQVTVPLGGFKVEDLEVPEEGGLLQFSTDDLERVVGIEMKGQGGAFQRVRPNTGRRRRTDSAELLKSTPAGLRALKYLVILADTLGSLSDAPGAAPFDKAALKEFIRFVGRPPEPFNYAEKLIPAGRVSHAFQVKAGEAQGRDAFLLVGCGRGKTDAAYRWADPSRRLVFTTPTTGTSSQLKQDAKSDAATGRHSRALVDYTLEERRRGAAGDVLERLTLSDHYRQKYLTAWPRDFAPVTFATVDQVLGVLSNSRKAILWLTSLIWSQIVMDEFHAYDHRMSEWFRLFRKTFPGIPILGMSASVPKAYLDALLEETAGTRQGIIIEDANDESCPATWERYQVHYQALPPALPADKSVLWIVNTVIEAQNLYDLVCKAWPSRTVLLYHARFTYDDRVKRHQEFVEAFRKGGSAPIGIATQVAEMSLDISADVLVSEIAPIASMIQRLGRLNRYLKRGGPVGEAFFYPPTTGYPYTPTSAEEFPDEAFEEFIAWVRALDGRRVSQQDLMLSSPPQVLKALADSVNAWDTQRQELREVNDSTVAVLREQLQPLMNAGRGKLVPNEQLQLLEIPVSESSIREIPHTVYRYRHVLGSGVKYTPERGLRIS